MKFKKIIFLILIICLFIPLASCDIHLENLFNNSKKESSSATPSSWIIPSSSVASSSSIAESSNMAETSNLVASSNANSSNIIASSSSIYDKADIRYYLNDYHDNYGYKELCKVETYGDTFKNIYEAAYNQALEVLTSTSNYSTRTINGSTMVVLDNISFYNTGITADMAGSVIMMVVYDNPLFYFLRSGYTNGSKSQGGVLKDQYVNLTLNEEYADYSVRQTINNYILDMFNEFDLSQDLSTYSDVNKTKYINNYITNKIDYAYKDDGETPEDSSWAHNIEGFVNPTHYKGVCECYSKTYELLSRYTGIESILVTGYSNGNPANGHAWNYTMVDDKWYGVDVTWNDTSHNNYLLVGSNKMESSPSHTPNGQNYGVRYMVPLPTLETNSYSFFPFGI